MEQTAQLTSQELVDRFSQIGDRGTALRAVALSVLEKLSENYQDLRIREIWGDVSWVYHDVFQGYSIQQATKLQTPGVEIVTRIQPGEELAVGKGFFRYLVSMLGPIKKVKTHEVKELAFMDCTKNGTLCVKVNEKPVIEACEEIARRTGGTVPVEYSF